MPEYSFGDYQQHVTEILHSLEEENWEDIETITQILSKITHLPSEQIKPRLHTLMESLIGLQEVPFHAKATPEEWSQRFHEWVEGHRELEIPSLSDEAISRENIYGDER